MHDCFRQPGGDYQKKLIVKNLSPNIQKIKYKLPATKFFYLQYPEVIALSPGMFITVLVNFRPIKMVHVFNCQLHLLPPRSFSCRFSVVHFGLCLLFLFSLLSYFLSNPPVSLPTGTI